MWEEEEVSCLLFGTKGVGKTTLLAQTVPISPGQNPPDSSQNVFKGNWSHSGIQYNITITEINIDAVKQLSQIPNGAVLLVFVYDITSSHSFVKVKKFIKALLSIKQSYGKNDFLRILIVGNKNDKENRQVTYEEGKTLGQIYGHFLQINNQNTIPWLNICEKIWTIKPLVSKVQIPAAPPELQPMIKLPYSQASASEVQIIQSTKQLWKLFYAVIIGAEKCGKTNFQNALFDKPFEDKYIPTIGIDFKVLYTTWKEKHIKQLIWVTSGQQKYQVICQKYYKGAKIFLVMYDIGNRTSFLKVQQYVQTIRNSSNLQDKVAIAIVGNKIDLDRNVKREEGQQLASKLNALFFQITCKDKQQVKQCFLKTVEQYLISHPEYST